MVCSRVERRLNFAETADDDFIGIQTYTRLPLELPRIAALPSRLVLRSRRLTEALLLPAMRRMAKGLEATHAANATRDVRRTLMGYEWAPDAVATTARRAAALYPGKPLLVTEHGVGTHDDEERIEYLTAGVAAIQSLIHDGIPIAGYFHWSLLDNWEWWHGYRPTFGLVAVDRQTLERTIKPSARRYGDLVREFGKTQRGRPSA